MSHLAVVEGADTPGRSAIRLMAQARLAGEQQVSALLLTLERAIQQSLEIVEGGEVYPAGVRDLAAKLADHATFKAQSISIIMRPVERSFAPFLAMSGAAESCGGQYAADET